MVTKKIILSANTSWYLYNFRRSTIKALKDRGYDVVVVAPFDDYSSKLSKELDCIFEPVNLDNKGINPLKDLFFVFQIVKIFYIHKPILIYNFTIKNNIFGSFAAFFFSIPVVNNISGLGTTFINKNIVSIIVKYLYKFSQPLAHKVYCQNEDDYNILIKNKLVPSSKLELIPGSGVNISRFNPSLLTNKNKKFTFLYVGRMLYDKGLFELIEASSSLYEYRQDFVVQLCGFVGSENHSAIPENKILEWDKLPFIEFLGPSDSVEFIYSNSNCVVLPSYREGMPRSLLEAGAMGLPSIATRVAGCRNIIEHFYNGLLCDVKCTISLSKAMNVMLEMKESCRYQLGLNARNKVKISFDEKIVVEKTISILNEI
jgi:glycosyltransferase involved in cell wall biosynthesis